MKKFIRNKKILLLFVLLGFFFIVSRTFALEIDWPKSPVSDTVLTDDSVLGDMVKYFYEWGITMGGLVTFFSLLIGGFKYLTSIGRPTVMKEATDQITSAFLGLILLLSSWLILNTISPQFTTFQANPFQPDYIPISLRSIDFEKIPPCDYAILYSSKNFEGPIGDKLTTRRCVDATPMSIKTFYSKPADEIHCNYGSTKCTGQDCCEPITCDSGTTECECGFPACGCTLQLFAKADCGDKIGDANAWEEDLSIYTETDTPIKSVRMSGGGTPCEGWLADDGLGGKGCWYKGRSGESCDTVCTGHGGCVEKDWNDNANCDICRHFFRPVYHCYSSDFNYYPGYEYQLGTIPDYMCIRRGDSQQKCNDGFKHSSPRMGVYRLCVCKY